MNRLFALVLVVMCLLGAQFGDYAAAQSSVSDTLADLEGLPFDAFLDESFNQFLLRDPETITSLGLSEAFGMRNDTLTNISDEFIRETQALESGVLDLLREYDRASLTPAQRLSYDIYEWYLDDLVRGHAFMYDNYPVSPIGVISIPQSLILFFTDVHPVTNRQDAEDYITRLSQVDTKFEQLIDGLQRREATGVILPRFLISWTINNDLLPVARNSARHTSLYTVFAEKVNALTGITDTDKQALLAAAETEIDETVIPAFQALVEYLRQQEAIATDDIGVGQFPDGEVYYNYVLRHHTTTDMTVDEIHELGLQEVERIRAEMLTIFAELGYPTDESLAQLFARVAEDSGLLSGDEIRAGYETIITEVDQSPELAAVFDLRPSIGVVVLSDPVGGFYSAPALDGSRPGAFYAATSGVETWFSMPTLAYHEAIPGHHFQIGISQQLDLPSFRTASLFTAYVEGWALYAERLVWELGFYEDDPYGNLGRLQAEIYRAVRLVVDTGIHAKGWTFDQAVSYMQENIGYSQGEAQYNIARYAVWPGQATAYMIGMLEILELRQLAMDQLGDRFDLREFHNLVLGAGAMPLNILEQVAQDYIDAQLAG